MGIAELSAAADSDGLPAEENKWELRAGEIIPFRNYRGPGNFMRAFATIARRRAGKLVPPAEESWNDGLFHQHFS